VSIGSPVVVSKTSKNVENVENVEKSDFIVTTFDRLIVCQFEKRTKIPEITKLNNPYRMRHQAFFAKQYKADKPRMINVILNTTVHRH